MKILKASIEKTGNKVIEVKNILEIREWLETDEDLYMFFENMVEILDIFYTKQYDRKYENEFISAIEGNKHIKIFGVVNNEKYMLLAGRKLFEVIRRDTSGIYLGGNLDRQNLFDCSKVSFSKQCVKQPLGIGMYFGGTNGECFDIVIPKFV